jgi:hypothetical protein
MRNLLRRLLPATDTQCTEAIRLMQDIEGQDHCDSALRNAFVNAYSQHSMNKLILQLRDIKDKQVYR